MSVIDALSEDGMLHSYGTYDRRLDIPSFGRLGELTDQVDHTERSWALHLQPCSQIVLDTWFLTVCWMPKSITMILRTYPDFPSTDHTENLTPDPMKRNTSSAPTRLCLVSSPGALHHRPIAQSRATKPPRNSNRNFTTGCINSNIFLLAMGSTQCFATLI
jgi:hypothetical protein